MQMNLTRLITFSDPCLCLHTGHGASILLMTGRNSLRCFVALIDLRRRS
jgi:hypothetical protein